MSVLIALIFHSSLGILVSKLTHYASFKMLESIRLKAPFSLPISDIDSSIRRYRARF